MGIFTQFVIVAVCAFTLGCTLPMMGMGGMGGTGNMDAMGGMGGMGGLSNMGDRMNQKGYPAMGYGMMGFKDQDGADNLKPNAAVAAAAALNAGSQKANEMPEVKEMKKPLPMEGY